MTTVKTTQSPDLLLSMLMGMLGSAPAPATAPESGTAGLMFADVLDSIAGNSLEQSDRTIGFSETLSETGEESDLFSSHDSSGGELNALMAASLGIMPSPLRQPSSPEPSSSTSKLLTAGEPNSVNLNRETRASAHLVSAETYQAPSISNERSNAKSRVIQQSQSDGFESTSDGPIANRPVPQVLEQSADASELGKPAFSQDTAWQNSAGQAPIGKNQAEIAFKSELNPLATKFALAEPTPQFTTAEPIPQLTSTEPAPQLTATDTTPQPFAGPSPELESLAGVAIDRRGDFDRGELDMAQIESPHLGASTGLEANLNRPIKSRTSKVVQREADVATVAGALPGSFLGLEESPLVTAIGGGSGTRQDGIQGKGVSSEELVVAIKSRDSGNDSPQLMNMELGQQLGVDAAQSNFEQSLDRVAENFPLESVAKQIVEVAEPDSGWISVEIQPPNLGKLEIMVSKQGEEYAAQIIAHEPSTQEALNLQQAELLEALNQHGLELKEVQIVSDSDSGNRWNLDSSRQDSQDGQSRGEFSGERREDGAREYPARDHTNNTPKVMTPAAGRQQVNLLV